MAGRSVACTHTLRPEGRNDELAQSLSGQRSDDDDICGERPEKERGPGDVLARPSR